MKILFTGRGGSGSWAIRGEQIGHALGATVVRMASVETCRVADVIVAVKRVPDDLLQNIRKSGRPWVYDVVDAYPQPLCSSWGEMESKAWLKEHLARLRPDYIIWPSERMQEDWFGGSVIYHHHRPEILKNPIRESIKLVGYEGAESYIQRWRPAIEYECKKLGARFVMNPAQMADVDVVLALRGKDCNGYPQRHWKSQVKLANAHGSGTPFIGAPEDSYLETATGAECFVKTPDELATALHSMKAKEVRQSIQARFLTASISIDQAAERYRSVLCGLKF